VRRRHPRRREPVRVIDTALGLLVTGVRVGRTVTTVGTVPARVAYRSPLGDPWRAVMAGLALDGVAARRRWQETGEAALDRALAGTLTERLAGVLGEHRVVERIAQELIAQGTVTTVVDEALRAGLADQLAERLLEHELLDSRVLLELTDRVLRSEEMQHVIAHIAASPELRTAIAEQSSGLADDMVAGVRQRTVTMDDVAERTVRGWLRRPRPSPT
jgi:hypothetical protein